MVTQTEIETKVRLWMVEHVTTIDEQSIIFDHQDGKLPGGAYMMINLIRTEKITPITDDDFILEASFDGTDGNKPEYWHMMCGEWEWSFSIHVYGKNPIDHLMIIPVAAEMLEAETGLDPLIISNTSIIRRLPVLINENWEDRAQIDITVRGYVNTLGVLVDSIEEITAEFTRLNHASKDATHTTTIIKP